MKTHSVRVHRSKDNLKKEDQLAWKLAKCALDPSAVSHAVSDMIINRIIDNAAVAVAALERKSVSNARDQAMLYPHPKGATVFGCSNDKVFFAHWAAWANGVAVRELDFHDTFLAADYAHPGDNIPPILALAQQMFLPGANLIRGVAAAYEIHIALVKSICLHKHKIDHIAHLCPSQVAGIGALLSLNVDTLYQSINQAVHLSFTTRQSRKGDISSWKAYAPAYTGKLALEAVDRCFRGEKAPSPVYEGEDSVIACLLDGPSARYSIDLPKEGEEKRAILESYTKEHSAEYHSQALIDLAFEMRKQITDLETIKNITIYTSSHTHRVIGTGSGDPQKLDFRASRETLDHSLTYIFAVALEDGIWHHKNSYTPERAQRNSTIRLWQKIVTCEEEKWNQLYHQKDPAKRSFGGRVEIFFQDGSKIEAEKHRANAHPLGDKPFKRADYIQKFMELSHFAPIEEKEKKRFLSLAERLPELSAKEMGQLNVQTKTSFTKQSHGILD